MSVTHRPRGGVRRACLAYGGSARCETGLSGYPNERREHHAPAQANATRSYPVSLLTSLLHDLDQDERDHLRF
ncbi:hypothetical protein FRAHR75_200008 [Frankia sp. Hr75.2]|nr:hypothetical protein FRAHR75_200008 [Frankia sp. Hr75.2]SQE00414.1 hypothetical protein FMEAI12_6500100 [Parafrankia sp. Ea1.12]